jgi:hypothetical protein
MSSSSNCRDSKSRRPRYDVSLVMASWISRNTSLLCRVRPSTKTKALSPKATRDMAVDAIVPLKSTLVRGGVKKWVARRRPAVLVFRP